MNINQSTTMININSSPRYYLNLSLAIIIILIFPFMTLLTTQNEVLADTEIIIDPYNDSGLDFMPMETPIKKNNSLNSNEVLPTLNENSPVEEIYINGNNTPIPPREISGNLIKSNEVLPQIPSVSQPYSKPDVNNDIITTFPDESNEKNSNVSSVSISPFEQTPEDTQPNIFDTKKVLSTNNNPRTINLNPNIPKTINPFEKNINSEFIPSTPSNPIVNKRRSLNDILVFSTPTENTSNIENIKPLTSFTPINPTVNRASSLLTKNNNVYKVLVKINNSAQESQIKSLYPESFRTNYQGQSLLQIGAFGTSQKAEEVSQSLINRGLNVRIIN